ncbi:MAG: MinD/ParA family protein [Candidatus Marinimicrobia bacterium]|nr:MinD/ParA family protein [Candidatus Neomarinimicrobiota bacterium]
MKAKGGKSGHPEVIAVTSGKGGVGKTMISVNLALILKKLNKNVLLFDADIHLGNVDLMLGLRPEHSISDIFLKDMDPNKVIVKGPEGLDILPAASAVPEFIEMEDDALKKFAGIFSVLEKDYDIILVDTGAGLSKNVMSFVLSADKITVVVTPDPASIADAYGMIKVIKSYDKKLPIMLITNMVNSDSEGESLYKKMNLMVQRFLGANLSFGGSIVRDDLILSSVRQQVPITIDFPNSNPAKALKMATRRLFQMPSSDPRNRAGLFDRILISRDVIIGENA